MLEVIHCDSRYTEVKGSAVMFHGTEGFRWATTTATSITREKGYIHR